MHFTKWEVPVATQGVRGPHILQAEPGTWGSLALSLCLAVYSAAPGFGVAPDGAKPWTPFRTFFGWDIRVQSFPLDLTSWSLVTKKAAPTTIFPVCGKIGSVPRMP